MEKDEKSYDLQPLSNYLIPDQPECDRFDQLPYVIDFALSPRANDIKGSYESPASPQLITLLELAPMKPPEKHFRQPYMAEEVQTLENTEGVGVELDYGVGITSLWPAEQKYSQPTAIDEAVLALQNMEQVGVELDYEVGITSLWPAGKICSQPNAIDEAVLALQNIEQVGVELDYRVGITSLMPAKQICSQPNAIDEAVLALQNMEQVGVELDYEVGITSLWPAGKICSQPNAIDEAVLALQNIEQVGVELDYRVGITSLMPAKQICSQPNAIDEAVLALQNMEQVGVELDYEVGITSLWPAGKICSQPNAIDEAVLALQNIEQVGVELDYRVGITSLMPAKQICSQPNAIDEAVLALQNMEQVGVELDYGVGITSLMPAKQICSQPNTIDEGVLALQNTQVVGVENDYAFNEWFGDELLIPNEPSEQVFSQPHTIEEGRPAQNLYDEFDYGVGASSLIPNESLNEQEGSSPYLENCAGNETVVEVNKKKKRKPKQDKSEKIKIAMEKKREKYSVKGDCSCKRQCSLKISFDRRVEINKKFWELDYIAQKLYVQCQTTVSTPSRTKHPTAARLTIHYFFHTETGENHQVCQHFFLTTLGFKVNNNTFVRNALDKEFPEPDGRGKHLNKAKFDETIVIDHIMSFHPETSHYRREHAPHRIYLPSDVTITKMHKLYIEQHPNKACSYDYYRKVVDKMNISFTKLGHEKCEKCEEFYKHMEITHGNKNENCEACIAYTKHKQFYDQARIYYLADKLIPSDRKHVIVSADLEKVVMLPRMEQFKDALFTKRICAFNETFAPLGGSIDLPVSASVWHEGVAGRKKEELISCYHSFLLSYRDATTITIWCDNCTSQNKCWALFSFFVYIVNSTEIAAESITLKFLEKGHTFMSADSFHHQVELSMKNHEKGNVYDFADFADCVQSANSGRVLCKQMGVADFADWQDWSSLTKLNNAEPRPYITDMSKVKFSRRKTTMFYANNFDGEWTELDFIMRKHQAMIPPEPKSTARGISQDVKDGIIRKLTGLMSVNRRSFWYDIPTN